MLAIESGRTAVQKTMTPWHKVRVGTLVVGVLICSGFSSPPPSEAADPSTLAGQFGGVDVANAIRATVHDRTASATLPLTSATRRELTALYQASEYRPVWVDGSGRPTGDARDMLALLTGAAQEGLDPVGHLG